MRATRFNHVSVQAYDLDESARFYQELFGLERIVSPQFPHTNVVWLQVGDQQLHLFRHDGRPAPEHHFSFEVDDVEAVYLKAKEMGALVDDGTYFSNVWHHATGWLQWYLRDPAGNLVEISWPDGVTTRKSAVPLDRPATAERR